MVRIINTADLGGEPFDDRQVDGHVYAGSLEEEQEQRAAYRRVRKKRKKAARKPKPLTIPDPTPVDAGEPLSEGDWFD